MPALTELPQRVQEADPGILRREPASSVETEPQTASFYLFSEQTKLPSQIYSSFNAIWLTDTEGIPKTSNINKNVFFKLQSPPAIARETTNFWEISRRRQRRKTLETLQEHGVPSFVLGLSPNPGLTERLKTLYEERDRYDEMLDNAISVPEAILYVQSHLRRLGKAEDEHARLILSQLPDFLTLVPQLAEIVDPTLATKPRVDVGILFCGRNHEVVLDRIRGISDPTIAVISPPSTDYFTHAVATAADKSKDYIEAANALLMAVLQQGYKYERGVMDQKLYNKWIQDTVLLFGYEQTRNIIQEFIDKNSYPNTVTSIIDGMLEVNKLPTLTSRFRSYKQSQPRLKSKSAFAIEPSLGSFAIEDLAADD